MLEKHIYTNLTATDKLMDHRILQNFSSLDSASDKQAGRQLDSLDKQADSIKSYKLRENIRLYTMISRKILALHRDPHVNFEALGPLLETYSRTIVTLNSSLRH